MKKAYNLIRDQPWYRRAAFSDGLRAAGFDVVDRGLAAARPGDVLVIWNRYGSGHEVATRFEAAGGIVLVAENGYLGRGGTSPKFDVHPKGPRPEHYYAVAMGGHNGQGTWRDGGSERWATLAVEIKPWRSKGDHILVCPNRSFGYPGRIMPVDWAPRTAERIRKSTGRPVRIRAHPGNDAPKRTLQTDLEGAWAVVIWSSGAGLHALLAGVPTFVESGWWICKDAEASGSYDAPIVPERFPSFRRLAWAQWRIDEIQRGEPFAHLLAAAREDALEARA